MEIWSTLSRRKEHLPKADKLKLFVCGPTVYDYLHIGNGRVYVVFDSFVKYLRSKGIKITYLQNITDIDDKIIARAELDKSSFKDVADKFTKAFKEDMKHLGVTEVDTYAPATHFIPQILEQVKKLIKKKHVYKIEGDGWYFDLKTFKDYGKLSGRTAEQAEDSVSRIDEAVNKRNKGDFAVWKFSKPGEPVWKTELGAGRPGWHIEDTAISEFYFGPQYDLHGGGLDLMFPHHEAEIAQEESISGKIPFVKIWMHAGLLTVDGKKMSKSVGNVITIRDFLKDNGPDLFRFLILSHHYRQPFDYNAQALTDTKKAYEGIAQFLAKSQFAKRSHGKTEFGILSYEDKFREALGDDFNTPQAIAAVFELINAAQPKLFDLTPTSLKAIHSLIKKSMGSIGVSFPEPKAPLKIRWLASRREKYRGSQEFTQSDGLRKRVDDLGYIIEDTAAGPFLWPKNLI